VRFLLFFVLSVAFAKAQVGGVGSFQSLALQPNARIAAIGGSAISLWDNDLNLAVQNPAQLKAQMDNQITYNHVFLFNGIGAGYAGVAKHYDSVGTFAAGIQYVNYGDFKRTLSNGEVTGSFTAGDYCFNMGYAKKLSETFSVGGQLKLLYSSLAEYASYGLAADLGFAYYNSEQLFGVAGTINNVGNQLKTYANENTEPVPLNMRLGITKKFLHNPFRLTLVANHLERPGQLLYVNNQKPGLRRDLETGEIIPENITLLNRTLAHFTVGTEVILGKNFYVALAYNNLRRREMKLEDFGGFAGFSWGFGIKVSKLQIAYGNTGYYIGRGSNHLSFIFNLNDFTKKKSIQS
jgi:hypothetical protein